MQEYRCRIDSISSIVCSKMEMDTAAGPTTLEIRVFVVR